MKDSASVVNVVPVLVRSVAINFAGVTRFRQGKDNNTCKAV